MLKIKLKKLKYQFIHITKTGGTAVKNFLNEHYKDHFETFSQLKHHELRAKNVKNPITIIRDPIDRYISIYNYWKKGSEAHKRQKDWVSNIDTVHQFTEKLISDWDSITSAFGYTWFEHFIPQSEWISPDDYSKTIIIKYKPDLNKSIQFLLDILNINKGKILKKSNITNKKIENLNEEDLNFINEFYKEDIKLYKLIHTNPEKFKKVIL